MTSVVDTQSRVNVNLTIKPGPVNETVTVYSALPLLESQTRALGQVITTLTKSTILR
ncbi:MAG: hypothetical protein P4K93_08115 [Terracidiphilus sp.]|nr:hypothetical protein [Terracidiphilus sp.]